MDPNWSLYSSLGQANAASYLPTSESGGGSQAGHSAYPATYPAPHPALLPSPTDVLALHAQAKTQTDVLNSQLSQISPEQKQALLQGRLAAAPFPLPSALDILRSNVGGQGGTSELSALLNAAGPRRPQPSYDPSARAADPPAWLSVDLSMERERFVSQLEHELGLMPAHQGARKASGGSAASGAASHVGGGSQDLLGGGGGGRTLHAPAPPHHTTSHMSYDAISPPPSAHQLSEPPPAHSNTAKPGRGSSLGGHVSATPPAPHHHYHAPQYPGVTAAPRDTQADMQRGVSITLPVSAPRRSGGGGGRTSVQQQQQRARQSAVTPKPPQTASAAWPGGYPANTAAAKSPGFSSQASDVMTGYSAPMGVPAPSQGYSSASSHSQHQQHQQQSRMSGVGNVMQATMMAHQQQQYVATSRASYAVPTAAAVAPQTAVQHMSTSSMQHRTQASPDSTTTAQGKKPRKPRKRGSPGDKSQPRQKKKKEDMVSVSLIGAPPPDNKSEEESFLQLLSDNYAAQAQTQVQNQAALSMVGYDAMAASVPAQSYAEMKPVQQQVVPSTATYTQLGGPMPGLMSDYSATGYDPGPPSAGMTELRFDGYSQSYEHPLLSPVQPPDPIANAEAVMGYSEPAFGTDHQVDWAQEQQPPQEEPQPDPGPVVAADVDDDFAHLATEDGKGGVVKKEAPWAPPAPVAPAPVEEEKAAEAKQPKKQKANAKAGFMGSFLSFLQGEKAETLSSVTNSAITKKPDLPKYIPEPPRPKPPPPPPAPPKLEPRVKVAARHDSDDDDDDLQITRTEKSVSHKPIAYISSSDSSKRVAARPAPPVLAKRVPSAAAVHKSASSARPGSVHKVIPVTIPKDRIPKIISAPVKPSAKPPKSAMQLAAASAGKRRASVVKAPLKKKKKRGKKEVEKEAESVLPRKRLSRRAKDVKASTKLDSDVEELSADDEPAFDDSDSDPDWGAEKQNAPGAAIVLTDSEDDDEMAVERPAPRPLKPRPRKPQPPQSAPRRPGGETARGSGAGVVVARPDAEDPLDMSTDEDDVADPPHDYQKLDFVLAEKDCEGGGDYPLWRIEGGGLVQRYNPRTLGPLTLHQASSAFSTWDGERRRSHRAVLVERCGDVGGDSDTVRLQPRYCPRQQQPPTLTPEGAGEVDESDPLHGPLNSYLQVTCSQAMEPSFLEIVSQEKDGFHVAALETVELVAEQHRKRLLPLIAPWTNNTFKSMLLSRPKLTETFAYSQLGLCSVDGCGSEARHTLRLRGRQYNGTSLRPSAAAPAVPQDFHVCSKVKDTALALHSLHHFRWKMVSFCKTQVRGRSAEDAMLPEILESCLSDLPWVLAMLKKVRGPIAEVEQLTTS